jgi:hypothetical protein
MSFMMTLPFLLCGSAPAVETNHDRRRGLPCAFLQGQQLPLPKQTLTEATAMLGEYTNASPLRARRGQRSLPIHRRSAYCLARNNLQTGHDAPCSIRITAPRR